MKRGWDLYSAARHSWGHYLLSHAIAVTALWHISYRIAAAASAGAPLVTGQAILGLRSARACDFRRAGQKGKSDREYC